MIRLPLIIFILLSISLLHAQNVRVEDYNVAVSKATNLRLNGDWNWSQVGDSVSGNRANAALSFSKFYSSLPFAWDYNLNARGGKDLNQYIHFVNFDARLRKYIWDQRDWFASSRINVHHEKNVESEYKQIASDLTIGGGYGRYINATALAKAVRIEEHLLRDGIIRDHLPKETMIKMANIIERQTEYRDLYEEIYETYWIDDIESAIEETFLSEDFDIGSIGILRIRQVLFNINERVNDRYYGWDVSAGILFTITTSDKSPAGDPNFSLNANYSYPVSWQTQINAGARVSTPVDTNFAENFTLDLNLDFIYELSNRINFVTDYIFRMNKPVIGHSLVNNLVNVSFVFYVENNINLIINGTYEKARRSPQVLSSSITLSYNFY